MYNNITILGIPLDFNSSHLRGTAAGPEKIREILSCGAMNWAAEDGRDLEQIANITDIGNLIWKKQEDAFSIIESQITNQLELGNRVLSLGGDHSVTYPIMRAYSQFYPELTVLHFDAHSDVYHDFEGNPYSHASPFARIMENNLISRLVQLGIRTITPHQRDQIERFRIEVIEMKDWRPESLGRLGISGNVYISFDMDALDPACAPGISHHEPGGLMTRDVLNMLQSLDSAELNLVGADIVEYNPMQDLPNQMTAFVAAKLLKEIVVKML